MDGWMNGWRDRRMDGPVIWLISSSSHQDIQVCVDVVSQPSDEDNEVGGWEDEGEEGHKYHPAL